MRNVKGRIERATVGEVVPEINKTVGDELVEKLKEELFDPTTPIDQVSSQVAKHATDQAVSGDETDNE